MPLNRNIQRNFVWKIKLKCRKHEWKTLALRKEFCREYKIKTYTQCPPRSDTEGRKLVMFNKVATRLRTKPKLNRHNGLLLQINFLLTKIT